MRQTIQPLAGWCNAVSMVWQNMCGLAGWGAVPEFSLQAWPNVNFKGDYHNLHNHPHSWLSGTYYLHVPDQSQAETFRSDLNPASISF